MPLLHPTSVDYAYSIYHILSMLDVDRSDFVLCSYQYPKESAHMPHRAQHACPITLYVYA